MKRLLAVFLVVITLLCMLPVSAANTEKKPIEVYYLGQKLDFTAPPQLVGGSTMVPMRAIFEALGYYIEWYPESKTVAATLEEDIIALTIGESTGYINSRAQPLDTPAILINSSTFVPLRFIAEASGYDVQWNDSNRSVSIEYSAEMTAARAERNKAFIEDLQLIKRDLPSLHRNLFFLKSRQSFNTEMDALIAGVPSMSDTEVKFELMRIINSVGDSHTGAYVPSKKLFNLSFFEFKEGIFLRDCTLDYADFLGKQLTGINGLTIEQIRQKLSGIVPQANESISKYRLCSLLTLGEYLKATGIIKSYDNVAFQFGKETLYASTTGSFGTMVSVTSEMTSKFPKYYIPTYDNYWYEYLPEKKAVYVNYNKCQEEDYSFAQFTTDIFDEIKQSSADTLILDLRDNGGGSQSVINPLLNAIKLSQSINRYGHLYVLIGRRTFSSAVTNTVMLKQQTKAILVGEPTGGAPNHYGIVKGFELPSLDMSVSYSTYYFNLVPGKGDTITPDIVVAPKAASFFAGKDDFLEAVYTNMAK